MNTEVSTSMQTVTPEQAAAWLEQNTNNRKLREQQVTAMVRDIQNSRWSWNGDSIKFADDGTLLDGQHRLTAIVRSGQPIEMLVIRGLAKAAQATMDTGTKRTASDVLKLQGEKNYTVLAAGIRSCILWENGVRNFNGGFRVTTNSDVLDYLEGHPEMRDYVETFSHVRRSIKLPATVGVLAVKVLTEIDEEDAEYFFERLSSAEGHYTGDPIFALRNALQSEMQQAGAKTRTGRNNSWKLAIIIKSWNRYRNGESVKMLGYRPGGANREKFPEPI